MRLGRLYKSPLKFFALLPKRYYGELNMKIYSLLALALLTSCASNLKIEEQARLPANSDRLNGGGGDVGVLKLYEAAKSNGLTINSNLFEGTDSSENAEFILSAVEMYGQLLELKQRCQIDAASLTELRKNIATRRVRSSLHLFNLVTIYNPIKKMIGYNMSLLQHSKATSEKDYRVIILHSYLTKGEQFPDYAIAKILNDCLDEN